MVIQVDWILLRRWFILHAKLVYIYFVRLENYLASRILLQPAFVPIGGRARV